MDIWYARLTERRDHGGDSHMEPKGRQEQEGGRPGQDEREDSPRRTCRRLTPRDSLQALSKLGGAW